MNDQAVDQFRAAVSETVNGDWDGTAPVLLSDFSLPAGASDPRPVSEDSDIEEVATVLPGDVSFANNGSGNTNGAFLAIGTGTHISNAADNASNLKTILGSRFNPTTSGFLSETGRLGSDGSLMVALSENSLNQELSLRYAAKEFDDLAAIPGTGAGGITELLNKAINDASPISVGNVVKNSQLNIAVSNAPYVQLETGNDVRLVMSDVKLNLQIDLGQGMITLVDSDLDLEAVLGFSVDADGQPDFNIESSDIGVSVLNVQSNDQVVINGVRLEGSLADQVESEVRKALLETLPEQIDDQLQELGDLILPRQAPFLANVGTDAPAALTNTLPKIFGLKVAQDGISVEGSHLLLKGELKDVTEGTNDTLVSMCIYSSADDLDTCPSQQP
ncbi:Uncharacterised protein [BD1-7 clade bacterium]|nr:Uncharacterised protein [BD1-7 clade bacterium]